ncbi:LOW QUALITY PROTEIN: AMSH-like ubiquitin thioesterase 3 [Carica papaya]|uniref:LOW QUALITY PROTEIN: AMSH-like ubiquitin thioesterase 3 n=1 Tax=Carica papaya TaxID=3649 RepID=UPI000B8CC76D|nr:LOW QUALITY PROTEIN: AMSH-like ubiquitin thioesterase 3 [Carica papaya]
MGIDVKSMARKVEVDNRIPLRNYYRIADNLLRQARIYRDEKNIVDLYIILLRYSSLVSETIPYHRDYHVLFPKERASYMKRLRGIVDELEYLKPEFQRRVHELNKADMGLQPPQLNGTEMVSHHSEFMGLPSSNKSSYSTLDFQRPGSLALQPSWKYNSNTQVSSSNSLQIDKQFQKLSSFGLPLPKKETLSRHSLLGPTGLRGQWLGPSAETKVQYPSNTDLVVPAENLGLNQSGQYDSVTVKDDDPEEAKSMMESVLSLDDGKWSHHVEDLGSPLANEAREDPFRFAGVKQPSPPPVLAQLHHDYAPICPSKVADPRPGPAKPPLDGTQSTESYQHLNVPVYMMEDFLRLARENTRKNLETCGVLAGSLKNRVFHITTLIIPKQESTSDSCQTLNEEEIFEVQDRLSLFPLGWIHTHPTQTCFMSSVDLHTHYSYQIMLPEAIAIVMAPTDASSPHGIFHLSDPAGVSVIRNCQQRGFHPHEEALDGSRIYEHCSHVYMNPKLKFDVVDLR